MSFLFKFVKINQFIVSAALLIVGQSLCAFGEVLRLDPLVVKGERADRFENDGSRETGALSGATIKTIGQGPQNSIAKQNEALESLSNSEMRGSGSQGGVKIFRGQGKTSDESAVTALGVPLNAPQGGGFDFQDFPAFFWSQYAWRVGPGASLFGSRASSGTLGVLPWNAAAMGTPESFVLLQGSVEGGARAVDLGVGISNDRFATIAGVQRGQNNLNRYSLGLSGKLYDAEKASLVIHFLGTNRNVAVPGSMSIPTPLAAQKVSRAIPSIVYEQKIEEGLVRANTFYSYWTSKYTDPANVFFENETRSTQKGGEFSWFQIKRNLHFGASVADYSDRFFSRQEQRNAFIGLNEMLPFGFTPGVELQYFSGFGPQWHPSLNWTANLLSGDSPLVAEVEISKSNRIPSLMDLYYQNPVYNYIANSELKPETLGSLQVSANQKWVNGFYWRLGAFFQYRENAIVSGKKGGATQIQNSGIGRSFSPDFEVGGPLLQLTEALKEALGLFSFSQAVRLNYSHLEATHSPFTYFPRVYSISKLRLKLRERNLKNIEFQLQFKAVSSVYDSTASQLPGYGLLDLRSEYFIDRTWSCFASIENVLDRKIELIRDYPLKGAVFVVGAKAEL